MKEVVREFGITPENVRLVLNFAPQGLVNTRDLKIKHRHGGFF